MGGLLDALYLLGAIFMSPFSSFALNADLLSYLFRYRGSEAGLKNRTHTMKKLEYLTNYNSSRVNKSKLDNAGIIGSLRKDFQLMRPIKKITCFVAFFCCRKNYGKMLLKSQSSITKEMDLRKFIYRQRL